MYPNGKGFFNLAKPPPNTPYSSKDNGTIDAFVMNSAAGKKKKEKGKLKQNNSNIYHFIIALTYSKPIR